MMPFNRSSLIITHPFLQLEIGMLQACIEVIEKQELPTLREILLRFPIILEIWRVFDEDSFLKIVAAVRFVRVTKSEGLPIDSRALYLFLGSGRILRRGREEREKSIRLKTKAKVRWGREGGGQKQGQACEVGEFGHFEQAAGEHLFYPHTKNTIVLLCEFEKLPQPISARIQELRAERLRFLHSFPQLAGIEKANLEEQLHNFSFAQLKFGAVRQLSTSSEVLFVKSGSIEVGGARGLQGRTIDGSCVVGLGNFDVQVKAVSESVISYSIKKTILQTLLAKAAPKIKESTSPLERIFASAVASPQESSEHPEKENRSKLCDTLRATTSFKRRGNMRSLGELNTSLQKQRRLHLRKHFSNFYNELFEEFSEKKARQLALAGNSEEKLVLYEIKVLQRKQPRMQEINEKLRSLRLQKMQQCKVAIAENSHIKELKNVGIAIV